MGVVAVLNDSGAANIGFEPISKKISGALSNIQLREILSHLSTINMHLKHRPKYSTLCDLSSGEALITASIPEDFEIERPYYETFGGLLHFTCGNIIRQSRIPNMEAFLAKIKEGNHTFLFNGDGTFKENVSREIRGNNSDWISRHRVSGSSHSDDPELTYTTSTTDEKQPYSIARLGNWIAA